MRRQSNELAPGEMHLCVGTTGEVRRTVQAEGYPP